MDNLRSKQHFLKALKSAGLPASYPTLLLWEKEGVIEKPKVMKMINGKKWRFYSVEEIRANIRKIKEHRDIK